VRAEEIAAAAHSWSTMPTSAELLAKKVAAADYAKQRTASARQQEEKDNPAAWALENFTDEGEVTEYLGCELVRDRKARTGQLIQAGYAERVLRVFNMWDCNPVATPMDPNVRLSKLDCPEVVDPLLHRKYRSIVGCLSYLVNMTRPDLAFSFSQLSEAETSCQAGWTAILPLI